MRRLVGAEATSSIVEPQGVPELPQPKIDEVAPRNCTGTLVKGTLVKLIVPRALLAPGDIGCITHTDGDLIMAEFICTEAARFALRRHEFTKAPSPCGCVGGTVYSTIDHTPYFKKGSKGTMSGSMLNNCGEIPNVTAIQLGHALCCPSGTS